MKPHQKRPRRENQLVLKGKTGHACAVIDIVRHEDGSEWGWVRGRGRMIQVKHVRGRYWQEITRTIARSMAGGGK